jgi:D-aspartate ligase
LIRSTGRIPTGRPPAIIVGLDCITGLQSARIFAARGIPVIGIVREPRHFCARSRVPVAIVQAPLDGEPLVDALVQLAPRLDQPGVLIPSSDAAVLAISAGRDRLADAFRFVLPDHADVVRLMDKVGFAEHALAHDLAIPSTAVLRSTEDARRAGESISFPAVLKPAIKDQGWLTKTKAKAFRVESAADLLGRFEQCHAWSDTLIVQSWVDGPEQSLVSVNAYYDRAGTERVSFVARKLRQWPLDTGTSCLGEEVDRPDAAALARSLFGSVAYRGLGYIEAKEDAATGRLVIIEPNIGRPTGRSAIAERGGVELLLSAYRDALGEPLPQAVTQRFGGVKWIYWRHDLQAAFVRARRGELSLSGWLASVRGPKVEAVFSRHDPVPFVADIAYSSAAALRGGIRYVLAGIMGRRSESVAGSAGHSST